jgi:SAM-dependent methyltransferase
MARYDAAFFRSETHYAMTSAAEIVPFVVQLISPASIVDVGCGAGGWLAVFQRHGVRDVDGYDGTWVNPELLQIDAARFHPYDLRQPLPADRRYDLALCLEVAEHLPAEFAGRLVTSLTRLAPVVLFSAAIPRQGGTGHANEQWQSWWAARFAECGYVPVDCIRRRIWDNPRVSHWYCQNLIVYADQSALDRYPWLAAERAATNSSMLDLVHPRMFTLAETSIPRLAKRALTLLPRVLQRKARAAGATEGRVTGEVASAARGEDPLAI